MRFLQADWIFPLNGPARNDAVLAVKDDGTIVAILHEDEVDPLNVERYEGVLCPGFINAHCHLELSHLWGCIERGTGLVSFLLAIAHRRQTHAGVELDDDLLQEYISAADHQMQQAGIVGVGDVSNTDLSFRVKAKSHLRYHTFVECFALNAHQAELRFHKAKQVQQKAAQHGLTATLTPHAPYSVSALLLERIVNDGGTKIFSIHYLESDAERELLQAGTGPLRKLLPYLNVGENYFESQPIQWPDVVLQRLRAGATVLLVHNTVASETDLLRWLSHSSQVFLCTCPNANLYIENQLPNYRLWKKVTDRICVGTDSLASNDQLSVLEELKTIQAHEPELELGELLLWACRNGAQCLGWSDLGTLEEGKRPGVNVIYPIDVQPFRLKTSSTVKRLI
ncbi:MAG: amidohydrolase family protein [Chitinophagales bacterium]|nr:amidohydrolase family protein [Chitinophagales bacterium]MDW8427291.1 amidohydrolase family protein [Chitinophagales bacterium]